MTVPTKLKSAMERWATQHGLEYREDYFYDGDAEAEYREHPTTSEYPYAAAVIEPDWRSGDTIYAFVPRNGQKLMLCAWKNGSPADREITPEQLLAITDLKGLEG